MLTFTKLGASIGTSLSQLAFLYSYATRNKVDFAVKEQPYADYFFHKFPLLGNKDIVCLLTDPFEGFEKAIQKHVIGLDGAFQNRSQWLPDEAIRELFRFNEGFIGDVYEQHRQLLTSPTIAVGIDRKDSPSSYITALETLGLGEKNIIFFSDDIEWCRFHFSALPKTLFPKFDTEIEAFCFGTLVGKQEDAWIISDSPTHWWNAFLAKPGLGKIKIKGDERIDLQDVTFTIPVKYDHPDRQTNLTRTLNYLQENFNTNILVGEQGANKFNVPCDVKYKRYDGEHVFHQSWLLNQMATDVTTSIIASWDADVLVPPAQVYEAVRRLRGGAEIVYPYDGNFIRIAKKRASPQDLYTHKDLPHPKEKSVGGACLYTKEAYFKVGGQNESLKCYGKNDKEFFNRASRLTKVERIPGAIYHYEHFIGADSSVNNPHFGDNTREYQRICNVSISELRAIISQWEIERGY